MSSFNFPEVQSLPRREKWKQYLSKIVFWAQWNKFLLVLLYLQIVLIEGFPFKNIDDDADDDYDKHLADSWLIATSVFCLSLK